MFAKLKLESNYVKHFRTLWQLFTPKTYLQQCFLWQFRRHKRNRMLDSIPTTLTEERMKIAHLRNLRQCHRPRTKRNYRRMPQIIIIRRQIRTTQHWHP